MPRKPSTKLTEAQKAFIVQHLACYDSPTEVAEAFSAEYGFQIAPQRCEGYDPTKRHGQRLSKHWCELFEKTRENFLKHVEIHIPEANKAVRVRHLVQAARAFKGRGNYVGMADMLERVAKELGNVHTNRREVSGRDGKPIEYADMTDEQLNARLSSMLDDLMFDGEDGEHDGSGSGDERQQQPGAGITRH